ncbi:TetR/AcrR family transcriptional regulator [Sciscionella sediminilitoris]|uniref:TetR/AcrR family transcriptional regulator n=1 Tax=Sciscionella sediminilitoris TaxID=1445613 RepID=UPI0004DFA920|nr:TetR family transcriptional regulator [Sciscionella sp. SE31]
MPKQVDHAQRRQLLAEAMWRLAHRDGVEAVSVRAVAAESGVSIGTVQHYFKTKDELLEFAVSTVNAKVDDRIRQLLTEQTEPRASLETMLSAMLPGEQYGIIEGQFLWTLQLRAATRPGSGAQLRAAGAEFEQNLAASLREHTRSADPELDATTLLALLEGLIAQCLQGRRTAGEARTVLAAALDRLFGA